VEWRIGLVLEHPPRIARLVVAGVPALVGEVQAAHERELVVDHDDLLVVRSGDRVRVVEAKIDAAVGAPREARGRRDLAVDAEHHRVVPVEDLHLQPALAAREAVEEIGKDDGRLAFLPFEHRAAVEVPAQDHDGALGALGGASE
jgi:hypothetical protein